MLKIGNVKVYDLAESIVASGYAMGLSIFDFKGRVRSFNKYVFLNGNTDWIKDLIKSDKDKEWKDRLFKIAGIESPEDKQKAIQAGNDLKRMMRLVSASKESKSVKCHHNAITGIRVSFDIVYPNYISPEMQRYHWFDIVTSSSKMHRLTNMDMDACFNEYVTEETKENMKKYIAEYNETKKGKDEEATYKAFMKVLSNCPQGIELFMRVSTNYMQLQTMYNQRKNHKLKEDWGAFCKFVETLPLSRELIIGEN